MIESLTQYWYMWLVLAVLIVVLIFVTIKASRAVSKRNETMRQQEEFAKHFKSLVEKYKNCDKQLACEAPAAELAEGITAALQYTLEKSLNPDEEFVNVVQWKREVYALWYFSEDCEKSLSFFFKNNGEPLPSVLLGALKSIGADKIYSVCAQMYSMYDENNESVSLDKNRVGELNDKFAKLYNKDEFMQLIKDYISVNI